MGESSSENDQQFSELFGFLQDAKLEVQRFAAQGILELTEDQDFLAYCQRNPRACARPLLRLAESAEAAEAAADSTGEASGSGSATAARKAALDAATAAAAGSAALQALVNLSAAPSLCDELVSLKASERCAEAMRAGWLLGRSGQAHWYAMLLANVTTGKAGQQALCAQEPLLKFLLGAYATKPRLPEADGYADPLLLLGRVFVNVCALAEGRRVLAGGEQGPDTLVKLMAELKDRARRLDVLGALRNICLDTECHAAVVATDLFAGLATFLYPWDKVEAAKREQLPEGLRATLTASGAALTADAQVRSTASTCLLGLCRSAEGREYLCGFGCQEVLRAWQLEERVELTRATVESAMQALQDSQEPVAAEAEASAADAPAEAEAPAVGDAPAVVKTGPLPQADPGTEKAKGDEKLGGLFDEIEGA
mmetsp:Transcript_81129/g.180332  ORF Transcript_81129/g.180332 Transcript_81129/m.180332 type:complete len:426 (-) Transcript_81129:92-1369(-)